MKLRLGCTDLCPEYTGYPDTNPYFLNNPWINPPPGEITACINCSESTTSFYLGPEKRHSLRKMLSLVYQLHFLDSYPQGEEDKHKDTSYDPNDFTQESTSFEQEYEKSFFCSSCAVAFVKLYKYFDQFNQLRKDESLLARKLQRLNHLFKEHHKQLHIPNQNSREIVSIPIPSNNDYNAPVASAVSTVIKCEILTEEGNNDEINFDINDANEIDDSHFDDDRVDTDVFSPGQEDSALQLQFVSDKSFNVKEGCVPVSEKGKHLFSVPANECDPASVLSPEIVVTSIGPWVKLERLKNVTVGIPISVSQLGVSPPPDSSRGPSQNSPGPSHMEELHDLDFEIENNSGTRKSNRIAAIRTRPTRKPCIKTKNARSAACKRSSLDASLNPLLHEEEVQELDEPNTNSHHEPEVKKRKSFPKTQAQLSKVKRKATKSATRTTKKKASGRSSKSKPQQGSKPKCESSQSSERKWSKYHQVEGHDRIDKFYRRRKGRAPNPCWHCPLDFPTQEECHAHTQTTHFSPGDFMCSQCSRLCANQFSFAQHQKICETLCPGQTYNPYPCPHCSKKFTMKFDLQSHLLKHSTERNFACSECHYKAKTKTCLDIHINAKHTENPKLRYKDEVVVPGVIHKCDICERTFKHERGKRIHMMNQHTEEGFKRYSKYLLYNRETQKEKRKAKMANKSSVCPECNVDMLSNIRLAYHLRTMHMAAKNYVCEQCGKDFSTTTSLRYHITYGHTDDRPFICEYCGKGFKTRCNLKDHVNHTHSEEGRLQYNQKMRRHNQRRKLVAQALAKVNVAAEDSNSTNSDGSRLQSTETTTYEQVGNGMETTDTSVPVSASESTSSFSTSVLSFFPGSSSYF